MDKFNNKVITFATALKDVCKEEENRELLVVPPLELNEDGLTEDFTAMIYAMWAMYRQITGDKVDILGFTHLCNRLVIQHIMKDKVE